MPFSWSLRETRSGGYTFLFGWKHDGIWKPCWRGKPRRLGDQEKGIREKTAQQTDWVGCQCVCCERLIWHCPQRGMGYSPLSSHSRRPFLITRSTINLHDAYQLSHLKWHVIPSSNYTSALVPHLSLVTCHSLKFQIPHSHFQIPKSSLCRLVWDSAGRCLHFGQICRLDNRVWVEQRTAEFRRMESLRSVL